MPDVGDEALRKAVSARKILEVSSSTLEAAVAKEDDGEFLYLLGVAMGTLSHLAYDVLRVQMKARTGDFGRFHEGFDNGIKTGEGIQTVFLTDREFEKAEAASQAEGE